MTAEAPGLDRCPKCGAAVRYGDPWCTLCYTDLRPPAPAPEPELPLTPPVAPVAVAGPDPLSAPLEALPGDVEGPSWPCAACGTVNQMALDICTGCGTPFLSGLRDAQPLLELPVVGDITRLSRGRRFALALGAIGLFLVLTVLLGLLFH